ncbi:hypothetical protein Z043-120027 [Arapaima gigas]
MSDPRRPFSLDRYHVSEEYGFVLPDPLTELPSYYKPWMDIAQNLPDLIQAGVLRSRVRAMPLLDTHLLGGHRELRLAHLALSMMTMGYVWQEGESSTVKVLPRNLAVPYWDVSQRLGLPPILTHADGVLANWRKKNPEGNLELIATIPGGESARGFFMVTLLVELAAAPGLQAIPRVINEMRHRSTAGVTNALEDITQALASMTEALKLMHVYVDPAVFYSVMRIYLSGWKDNPSMAEGLLYEGVRDEPLQFSGGSAAQSSLLHCFDELLGIRHEGSSGAFLSRMRDYMPPAHKQLIEDISGSPPLQAFVQEQATASLTEAYGRCVSQLLALRDSHLIVVSRFITAPAARARQLRGLGPRAEGAALAKAPAALEERGTGGSSITSFLKTVRNRTREARPSPPKLDPRP